MKFELCAATIEAIRIAHELRFDRIELCQSLEQGGLTPSPGMIDYALAFGVNTHVLIRPRAGGFRYDNDEIEIVLRDVLECKEIGAHGVVIGVLDDMGLINEVALENIMNKAEGMEVTFHRAFDDTYEYDKSLDILIKHGVTRVLSSGLARNVELGKENLKQMREYANGRIQIMPGGGVNGGNIAEIVTYVEPDAIHFSGTTKIELDEGSKFTETLLRPDFNKIQRLLELGGKDLSAGLDSIQNVHN